MNSTHYCIWGLCESQQYCCGDNVCCNETDSNFFVSLAISIGAVVFLILYYMMHYCIFQQIELSYLREYLKTAYTVKSNQRENKTNAARNQESIVEDCVV